jgi:hypothetical protein
VSNSLQRDLGRHRSDPGAIATTSVIRPRPEELVDELPGLGSKPVPGSIGMVRPEVGCVEKQWPIRQPLEVLSLQGYSMSQLGVQQVQEARLCDVAMRELCIQVELLRRASTNRNSLTDAWASLTSSISRSGTTAIAEE